MSKYRHIFFDLDHTLWDFHSNSVEALGELYLQFEIAGSPIAPSSEHFIERYIHHNERMWDLYRQNRISKSRLRKARFEAALHDMGIDDKRMAKRMGEAYIDICPKKTKLNDHALEVVKELHDHFALHIVTNGFQETQSIKLACSGLEPYFEHVITSERAQAKKPSERIFSYAENLTGAKKDESVMIGDNLAIDVVGAREFGWDAIHYNAFEEQHDLPSVRKLSELPGILFGEGSQ